MRDATIRGFLIILPILLFMITGSILRLNIVRINGIELNKIEFGIVFAIMLIILPILIYIYEIIYVVFYPKKAYKEVWRYTEQTAYFIYCDEKVSKFRFIILCLAPSIILGIIPYLVWLIIAEMLPISISICMIILTWIMVLVSMGDYYNVYNTITQVPNKSMIFNYGLHSYWIK